MRKRLYLQRGNAKLGRSIWTWTMPAVEACGAAPSAYCQQHCYAKAFARFPSAAAAHRRNWELARDLPRLRRGLHDDLQALSPDSVIRVHVAGDFFSRAYAHVWLTLMARFPHIVSYSCARAW